MIIFKKKFRSKFYIKIISATFFKRYAKQLLFLYTLFKINNYISLGILLLTNKQWREYGEISNSLKFIYIAS
jgi:hypothetical protein